MFVLTNETKGYNIAHIIFQNITLYYNLYNIHYTHVLYFNCARTHVFITTC